MSRASSRAAGWLSLLFLLRCWLVSSQRQCWEPYSCSDKKISWTFNTDQNCDGFASCSGDNTSITLQTGTVRCRGAISCTNIGFIETSGPAVRGFGYAALSQAHLILSANITELDCYSDFACFQVSNMSLPDSLSCQGIRSCSNMHGITLTSSNSNVYANGMLALQNSELSVAPGATIAFALRGLLAGFNATILCLSGAVCTFECSESACLNLNILCHTSSTCTLDCVDADSNCLFEPYLTYTNNVGTDLNTQDTQDTEQTYETNIALLSRIIEGVEGPNGALYQIFESTIEQDPCNGSNIAHLPDMSYNCDAYKFYACQELIINTSVPRNAPFCCQGRQGCAYSTFLMASDLYLHGMEAALGLKMNLNQANVFCRGYWACKSATVQNFDYAQMSGQAACEDCTISDGQNLLCLGHVSCKGANARNVTNIYGGALNSLTSLYVWSSGDDLNVFLLARDAAQGMRLTCTGTDTCTVYYLSNDTSSLESLDFVGCDQDATCQIKYAQIELPTRGPTQLPSVQPSEHPTDAPTCEVCEPCATCTPCGACEPCQTSSVANADATSGCECAKGATVSAEDGLSGNELFVPLIVISACLVFVLVVACVYVCKLHKQLLQERSGSIGNPERGMVQPMVSSSYIGAHGSPAPAEVNWYLGGTKSAVGVSDKRMTTEIAVKEIEINGSGYGHENTDKIVSSQNDNSGKKKETGQDGEDKNQSVGSETSLRQDEGRNSQAIITGASSDLPVGVVAEGQSSDSEEAEKLFDTTQPTVE